MLLPGMLVDGDGCYVCCDASEVRRPKRLCCGVCEEFDGSLEFTFGELDVLGA